jgi:galactofuranose transport system permease protein
VGHFPAGATQLGALAVILLIDSLVAPNFFSLHIQDGRLFGSRNRHLLIAVHRSRYWHLGMTLVIATGGIDLSVGAVMAIAGATAATHDQRKVIR